MTSLCFLLLINSTRICFVLQELRHGCFNQGPAVVKRMRSWCLHLEDTGSDLSTFWWWWHLPPSPPKKERLITRNKMTKESAIEYLMLNLLACTEKRDNAKQFITLIFVTWCCHLGSKLHDCFVAIGWAMQQWGWFMSVKQELPTSLFRLRRMTPGPRVWSIAIRKARKGGNHWPQLCSKEKVAWFLWQLQGHFRMKEETMIPRGGEQPSSEFWPEEYHVNCLLVPNNRTVD